jgi:hypothetical protein
MLLERQRNRPPLYELKRVLSKNMRKPWLAEPSLTRRRRLPPKLCQKSKETRKRGDVSARNNKPRRNRIGYVNKKEPVIFNESRKRTIAFVVNRSRRS